jgi:hypothetical protein
MVPEGGSVTITRQPFDVGTVAQYACAVGRTLVGAAQRTCQHSGVWQPRDAPVCRRESRSNQCSFQNALVCSFVLRPH